MLDLFAPGAYARKPGGNIERPADQNPVIDWMAWNIGGDVGGDPTLWDRARSLWDGAGIPNFPWLHCRNFDDVKRLVATGLRYRSPAIGLNLEDVFNEGQDLAAIGEYVQREWNGAVHMPMLTWAQNDQGWEHVSFAVAALEIMPDEQTTIFPDGKYDAQVVRQSIAHAFDEGLTQVTLMFKTKGHTREEFGEEFSICHSLYTADDIEPSTAGWLRWLAPDGCVRLVAPVPPKPPEPAKWYDKPYLTGPPVGPAKLPRPLYPPSAGKGTFVGDDAMAFKRAISRAGRLKPWAPTTWSPQYGEQFALGKGTGNVADSGVRGFQRQQFPDDEDMHTGNLGDKTYQAMRRARVSDPESPNFKKPLLDPAAVTLLVAAAKEFDEDAALGSFRKHVADFCERAEGASAARWVYDQRRKFTGLGVPPEQAHVNDCSSYVILAYYWGRLKSGLAVDDPSGYEYEGYGNTSDDLDGHPRVTSGNYLVGDLAHYGSGGSGHVTICRKAGTKDSSVWSSFGMEPKPVERELFYRPDYVKVVRPDLGSDL